MATTTADKVRELAATLKGEAEAGAKHLKDGREILRDLEGECRWLNGTATALQGIGKQLDELISRLHEEAVAIERKMTGAAKPKIVQTTSETLAEAVREAR